MISAVASRYAQALIDVVMEPSSEVQPAAVLAELGAVNELIAQSDDLRHILLSPAVPNTRKRKVIADFATMLGLSRTVGNFLSVVIHHRRIDTLGQIREAFQFLVDERMGVVRAEVASAQDLNAEQRQKLEAELSRISGKQARLEFSVDPSLVGGVMARIGSTVYDGSVRGQLAVIRQRLAGG